MPTDLTPPPRTNKKEVLFDYVKRIHGSSISRDAFEAIFAGAVLHHTMGEAVTHDQLRSVVEKHRPRGWAVGDYPRTG